MDKPSRINNDNHSYTLLIIRVNHDIIIMKTEFVILSLSEIYACIVSESIKIADLQHDNTGLLTGILLLVIMHVLILLNYYIYQLPTSTDIQFTLWSLELTSMGFCARSKLWNFQDQIFMLSLTFCGTISTFTPHFIATIWFAIISVK